MSADVDRGWTRAELAEHVRDEHSTSPGCSSRCSTGPGSTSSTPTTPPRACSPGTSPGRSGEAPAPAQATGAR
jgi:hypothetical protein